MLRRVLVGREFQQAGRRLKVEEIGHRPGKVLVRPRLHQVPQPEQHLLLAHTQRLAQGGEGPRDDGEPALHVVQEDAVSAVEDDGHSGYMIAGGQSDKQAN